MCWYNHDVLCTDLGRVRESGGGRCRGENIHGIIYSLHRLLDGFVELVFVSSTCVCVCVCVCGVSVVTV